MTAVLPERPPEWEERTAIAFAQAGDHEAFEWIFGQGPRLGLHSVDSESFARTVTPSVCVYADRVREARVSPAPPAMSARDRRRRRATILTGASTSRSAGSQAAAMAHPVASGH